MKPGPKTKKKIGGWKNPSSAANGKLGGKPQLDNLLEGLTNLETGEASEFMPLRYANMKAAAHALKLDIAILKDAKAKDCNAFDGSGTINRERLITWLKKHSEPANHFAPQSNPNTEDENTFEDNYDLTDEAGGVGQTLKSLCAYERRLKKRLDTLERATNLHTSVKAELVEKAQKGWLAVVGPLLKYELSVSLAKRESGELIPLAEAVVAVQALLAWHTVATSDALRNVIPECELKTKYEIAALLDPALRSAIYRNFKLGVKLGKIPDWMGKSATDFVRAEPPLLVDKMPASKDINDY